MVNRLKEFVTKNPVPIGLMILIIGFFVGIGIAIGVVESQFPSQANNDGWLGFLGGVFGSVISGLVSFYILYLDRRNNQKVQEENKEETRNIQEQYRRQYEYQIKKQFTDSITESIAKYITDICDYFYSQYIPKNDKQSYNNNSNAKPKRRENKISRKKAVEEYYTLTIKLKNITMAEYLLIKLNDIHNHYCFLEIGENRYEQHERFNEAIENLRILTIDFIEQYLKDLS